MEERDRQEIQLTKEAEAIVEKDWQAKYGEQYARTMTVMGCMDSPMAWMQEQQDRALQG